MPSIYFQSYHSQPRLHLRGATGQFEIVERAIADGEWPYDNGDDPSFYVARKGGPLTWGVCRQDVRNSIGRGDIAVFFSFTSKDHKVRYRLCAVATVLKRLDHRAVFLDSRFRRYRDLYLNTLIKPIADGWKHDETDREPKARHSTWLWRMAVHSRKKSSFRSKHKEMDKTEQFRDGGVKLAGNYILFSSAANETYIVPKPPKVAIARKGEHEKWINKELKKLTVLRALSVSKNGRDYLRAVNSRGRNLHRQIRFDLALDEARKWRQALISALRRGS
jgi:hypothetical protein